VPRSHKLAEANALFVAAATSRNKGFSCVWPIVIGVDDATMQIPAHCGHRFRRIADSVPVIADSRR
jgi:hypothetical protein